MFKKTLFNHNVPSLCASGYMSHESSGTPLMVTIHGVLKEKDIQ